MNFISIYRSGSPTAFFDEFPEFLETVLSWASPSIITGDFNIHVDNPSSCHTTRLNSTLQSLDLKQHINFPTHVHGHILDLLITPSDCLAVNSVSPVDLVSDHFCIKATLGSHLT